MCNASTPTGNATQATLATSDGYSEGLASAFDASGNLIVGGVFDGSAVTFGQPSVKHSVEGTGENAFVVKYDATGAHVWSIGFGGDADARARAVAVAPSGEIWVVVDFVGTLKIGNQTYTAKNEAADAHSDIIVVKLDADGKVLLSKAFINQYVQEALSIATDSKGNVYIAGPGWNTYDFGLGTIGDSGEWTTFVLKLDPTGAPLYNQFFSGFDGDLAFDYGHHHDVSIAVDAHDDAILASNFSSQAFFGSTFQAPFGGVDAFVLKLASAHGDILWRTFIHGPSGTDPDGDQWPTAVATDPCSGDVYVAGNYDGAIQLGSSTYKAMGSDPTTSDVFLAKLHGSDGGIVWSRTFGDVGRQEAYSVRADRGSNVVLTGVTDNVPGAQGIDFGAGIGLMAPYTALDAGSDTDAFILEIDGNGKDLWGLLLGGPDVQQTDAVAIDASGRTALVGMFNQHLAVGSGQPVLSAGYYSAFAAWFGP